jgi:LysM repeat protein
MKNLRQVSLGIMIALASLGLILGVFSLSLAEGNMAAALVPTDTLTLTFSPTLQPSTPTPNSPTPSPTWTPLPSSTGTPTGTPTATPSLPPPPTNCILPVGWVPYGVQSGDTLEKIAARYRVSSAALQQANCLLTTQVLPGGVLYVPPLPTQTPVPCGAPYNWIIYIVQPGDTLYRLSQAFGITVTELQRANCMGSSTLLHTGQRLYVPPWAARTPIPTITGVETPVGTMTNTPEAGLPTDTPTEIPTAVPTDTPLPLPSDTPVPTDTLPAAPG